MDPLTALGLASNIFQCIQFVSQILSHAREIRKSAEGAAGVSGISDIQRNLFALHEDLTTSIKGLKGVKLTSAEKTLRRLSEELKSLCGDVIDKLAYLGTKEFITDWDSVKLALLTAWKRSELEALDKRLAHIRQQVDTTLLICLR